MDYSDLDDLLNKGKELHKLTKDPMLPSAIAELSNTVNTQDPDHITLSGAASYAAECINNMWGAKITLYGK